MAAKRDLFIDQGASFKSTGFRWRDASKVPYDLTGYTARMELRRVAFQRGNPIVNWTSAAGKLAITPTDGLVMFNLEPTDTAALSGVYYYILELISPAGDVWRTFQGRVFINQG